MARILCVEDMDQFREIYRLVPAAAGHDVDLAEDGVQGLAQIQSCEYDLVITDVSMPGLNGPDMLAHAAEHLRDRTPCILEDCMHEFEAVPPRDGGVIVDVFSLSAGSRGIRDVARNGVAFRREWLTAVIHGGVEPSSAPTLGRSAAPRSQLRTPARMAAEHRVWAAFAEAGLPPPIRMAWYPSPRAALEAVARHPEMLCRPNPLWGAMCAVPGKRDVWSEPDGASLSAYVASETRAQLADEIRSSIGGRRAQAAHYLALLMALPEQGPLVPVRSEGATEAPACGISAWWASDAGEVVLADPPVAVHFDEHRRLHHPSTAAVLYADGSGVWALEGHRVPQKYVEAPQEVPVREIRNTRDSELRRTLRHRYAEERYLTALAARLVDADTVPVDAAVPGGRFLSRALIEGEDGNRYLIASDGSTNRVYHMRVPRACSTCREAYVALSGRDDVRTIVEA